MSASGKDNGRLSQGKTPALKYLIESALLEVAGSRHTTPKGRQEWLNALCDSLVSGSDTGYEHVITSMVANGVPEDTILENYIPDVAAMLGERWVQDNASFVEVAIGAARLQDFIRDREDNRQKVRERLIPLGQSVLLVIPVFEQHGLGVFIAANQFRRSGLWTHVAIGLDAAELAEQIGSRRFSMVGITIGSEKSVKPSAELIKYLRAAQPDCPPIVVGGNSAQDWDVIKKRTGADIVANSAREAIDRLGLAGFAEPAVQERQE